MHFEAKSRELVVDCKYKQIPQLWLQKQPNTLLYFEAFWCRKHSLQDSFGTRIEQEMEGTKLQFKT